MAQDGDLKPERQASQAKHNSSVRAGLVIVSFAVVFFLLQRMTFLLRFPPYERTTLWIPGALTFSVLLVTPIRRWWQIHIGLSVAGYAAYYGDREVPELVALLAAQFHFVTVAAGVILIRRLSGATPFNNVASMLLFVVAAGLLIPLATSAPADFIRWLSGKPDVWPKALRSFLAMALGLLIGTPAFASTLLSGLSWIRSASWQARAEALALAISLIAVGIWVFTTPADANTIPALVYAPVPFLLWAALRFEVAGASWALLVIGYLSTWNAINDRGPFARGAPDDQVLQLQLFLLAVSLPLLFMAAGVAERRKAYSLLLSEMDERRRVEERFRLVVDSTPSAILMVNREGEISQVNPQTERLFGYQQDELLSQSWERLFPQRLRALAGESLREFFASSALRGIASGTEMFGLRKDGSEFPLEVGLTPIESAGGLLALVAITDNTERKMAEEARRELVHASRLAVLSEFTTSIAHEINQPLGAILSNADAAELLLKKSPPPLEEVRQILADIRSDDLRASEVIRRLRTLLRQGEVERQSIDLNSVVNEVIFILRNEAQRRRVEVRTDLSSQASMVSGDKVHLQQILLNLMLNGMEAMAQTNGERRLTLKTEQSDGEVIVSVSDTGAGVSRDRLPKIFERFFSTKPEGMGMGLAISRSLVEEHGGRIWVESIEGQGSTFRFALPILPSRIEMKSLEPRSSAGVTG